MIKFWNGTLSCKEEGEGVILADKSCKEVRKLFVNKPLIDCINLDDHHHYPLHFQNWTGLKHILKEVWGYLSYVLEQPVSHKYKSNYLHPWRWAFRAPLFRNFTWLWLLMLLVVFLSFSLATSVNPHLL